MMWRATTIKPSRQEKTMFEVLILIGGLLAFAGADHSASELVGTWRGTSTCTDRVAAPACRDETIIYEFTPGAKSGTVTWKADKVVDGKRQPMGEMELAYDSREKCWAAEFRSATVQSRWCLIVEGTHLTGTGRRLPGKQMIRKIDARKD
jgi:hypothetical protein